MQTEDDILQVTNLKLHYPIRGGLLRRQVGVVQAVDGVTFSLRRGETLALVGGANSGKTSLARMLVQLEQPTNGRILFDGKDVTRLNKTAQRKLRQQIQLLFTNPYLAINPQMEVGKIVREPLDIHGIGNEAARRQRVTETMQAVGLNPYFAGRHPYEFSGAQRQRIGIARALATQPAVLISDAPAAALDPSVQAQIIQLLRRLQQEQNLAHLLLTDNLRLPRAHADRIGIMYCGRLVELADTALIYERPLHPYTQYLLSQLPLDNPEQEAKRQPMALSGRAPDPAQPPAGCRFHPRCPYAVEECRHKDPALRNLGTAERPHLVACHLAEQFLP